MCAHPLSFQLLAQDSLTRARAGLITTPHGEIHTPVFMPVGTQGAIRNLTPSQVLKTGAQVILANTYHMSLRPGEDLVRKAGGLHQFMGYDLPILTDSGGFQVFSLPNKEITPDGVSFQYEVDGQRVLLTPERSMQIQEDLGADIAMAFDECAPYPCSHQYALEALVRTTRWERRSREAHSRSEQALFGIVQGSMFDDLRRRSAQEIIEIGFDGYAIGGLSVGEGLEIMCRILEFTVPELPEDKPRYLMGVGLPEDILAAVERGIDMFDCVIPTRHARGGILYTFQGRIRIQQSRYRRDMYPIDTSCGCYTCQNFSRAYLRHLFSIREVLANTLASIHNIYFYQELTARIRAAIRCGGFVEFRREFMARYKPEKSLPEAGLNIAYALEHSDSGTRTSTRQHKPKSVRGRKHSDGGAVKKNGGGSDGQRPSVRSQRAKRRGQPEAVGGSPKKRRGGR